MSEQMKPSGIDWIGEIPCSWNIKRIKYLARLKGRIGWQGLTSDEYTDVGPFLITGVDFSDGGINWESCVHITEERWAEAPEIHIKNGDLLITKDGTVGKVAIVENLQGKASLNSGVLLIKTSDEYSKKFLYWALLSEEFWTWFRLKNAGNSTIIHLYQNDFAEFSYTFPGITEQNAIADFLDKECAQIDSIVADLEKQIALLQQYKKSLITETVTKGLDKSVPMKDSGVEWIGQIASSNYICRLKYLTIIKDGTHDTPAYVDEAEDTYPLITSKHIDYKTKQINFSSANHISKSDFEAIYKRSDVEYGDIIMPMIGTIGNPVIINTHKKFAIKNVALFKTGFDLVQAKYIFYQFYSNFLSEQFSLMSRGGVQSFVSLEVLENLIFVDCNQDQKKRIVKYLDATCEQVDELIIGKQNQLSIIQQHKQSLIYEYVTGKKRVKEVQ